MILALDIGTKLGWATYERGVFLAHGMENFTPKPKTKTRPAPHPGERFKALSDFLNERVWDSDKIVYEAVARHVGTRAAHVYGGFLAIILDFACANEIPVEGVAVGTIKKYATGSGRASKEQMIEAASAIVGYEIKDDNEADAICLMATERRHCHVE